MQLNKRFFVCTNNNTSNIEFITFNSWISSVDQCILQDFSSLPYDCNSSLQSFFCFFDKKIKKKKKKNTNRFHVAVKCGKNENRWHTIRIRLCHKRWIDVLCYSLLNRLTAKWNLLVLYNKKERKTTNLPSTTRLFKARRRRSVCNLDEKRYVSSLLLLFFFI